MEQLPNNCLKMYFSVAVLLLLFRNVIVSAQNCTDFPDVANARPVDRKETYTKGDTVGFICDTGYTSGRQIRYICTDTGRWSPTSSGNCRLKPCVLPDDIPNGYYQITFGDDFVFGTTIKYFCNDGYQMVTKEDTRTCLLNTEWSNHLPVCEPWSCDAPPPVPGVSVEGLPTDDGPILPDRFLTFRCDSPSSTLNGSTTLVCGKDGTWDNPFPNCVASCDVENVPDSVTFSPTSNTQRGQSLEFQCKRSGHVLQGQARVTCLEDGQWSHSFPSCTDPKSCGTPPHLDNGDFFTSSGPLFGHNSKVQYQCQDKYKIQGGPYKTCYNGVWTGDITCLKPCTVNPDLMTPNKIDFRWRNADKMYAPHDDYLEFKCIPGARHDGVVNMRQKCNDGEIRLPKCV